MIAAAKEADEKLVTPLFQFRNYGQQLPFNWSTISNEAAFGTDYYTRTAVAKSNILVNSPQRDEILLSGPRRLGRPSERCQPLHRHLREGADSAGQRLLVAHALQRASFLRRQRAEALFARHQEQDAQAQCGRFAHDSTCRPMHRRTAQRANWLPAPRDRDFSLYVRAYWPRPAILDGSWTPPAVER